MALSRRSGQRFQASIWPGFVDAMTGLLLVLMFVLTIIMVVQFVLRETITGQESELDTLSSEVAALSLALGLEQDRSAALSERVGLLSTTLTSARTREAEQSALIDSLTASSAAAEARITSFEEQVAGLLAERAEARAEISGLEAGQAALLSDKGALQSALEAQRRRAEETLTLLAAARRGNVDLQAELAAAREEAAAQMSTAEERAVLLSEARALLSVSEGQGEAAARARELLNQQVAALREQLGQLRALLDDSKAREAASNVEIQSLGQDLNAAIARAAAEEKRRREAEEARSALLEAQKQDLEKYRSEFFGRLRDVLGNQAGIRIEGDRFVFSSEVLFAPGQAALSESGKAEIGKVAEILQKVVKDIPAGIDWIIRVDGHTDDVPLRDTAEFADNWELSQARALSVVRYMVASLGLPPERLAANGFGQYQPVVKGDSPEARAQNRRIELKFTER